MFKNFTIKINLDIGLTIQVTKDDMLLTKKCINIFETESILSKALIFAVTVQGRRFTHDHINSSMYTFMYASVANSCPIYEIDNLYSCQA